MHGDFSPGTFSPLLPILPHSVDDATPIETNSNIDDGDAPHALATNGIIKPFHALRKSPSAKFVAQRSLDSRLGTYSKSSKGSHAARYTSLSGPNPWHSGVRNSSPLCHDVLDSMLDCASISSQESLPDDEQIANRSSIASTMSSSPPSFARSYEPEHSPVASPNTSNVLNYRRFCAPDTTAGNTTPKRFSEASTITADFGCKNDGNDEVDIGRTMSGSTSIFTMASIHSHDKSMPIPLQSPRSTHHNCDDINGGGCVASSDPEVEESLSQKSTEHKGLRVATAWTGQKLTRIDIHKANNAERQQTTTNSTYLSALDSRRHSSRTLKNNVISRTEPGTEVVEDGGNSDDDKDGDGDSIGGSCSSDDNSVSDEIDKDDGFDGRYEDNEEELLKSPATSQTITIPNCSRSSSHRSSRYSSNSDDSSSTAGAKRDGGAKGWLRRKFCTLRGKDSKRPQPKPPQKSSVINPDNTPSAPLSRLSRLRRTMSTKSAIQRNAGAGHSRGVSQMESSPSATNKASPPLRGPVMSADSVLGSRSKLKRNSTRVSRGVKTPSPPKTSPPPPSAPVAKPAPVSAKAKSPSPPAREMLAQWVLLKCKGVVNLHVVTTPTAISSLNHKDAFLLYPALFCKLRDNVLTSMVRFPLLEYCNRRDDKRVSASAVMSPTHSRVSSSSSSSSDRDINELASRVIYVWIGAHASALKRDAIIRVAMEIRDKELLEKAAIVIIDESVASDRARRKFFLHLDSLERGASALQSTIPRELPDLYRRITPLRRAGNDQDFERALVRRKVLYGFWESVPPATIMSVGSDTLAGLLLKVPVGGAVVLDTWADVFIWWRNEPCNSAVRRCAANFANMLIQDTCIPPRPRSAAVWHEVRGFEHVIFKTKFADWPFVFADSMTTRIPPRPSRPTSAMIKSSAMPPAAVPVRSSSRGRVVAVS